MKRKRLSVDAHIELSLFRRVLRDKAQLSKAQWLRKHQAYMGLSDDDLKRMIPS